MPGSVMPMAVISSPETIPGSHRCFCSSVQYARKYGMQMSLCRLIPSPAPESGVRSISSVRTALKRKSRTPPPPYSSGTSIPSSPCRPAAANSSRGVAPAALHASTCGRISLSTNVRAVARKASWSSSYSLRRMRSSLVPAGHGGVTALTSLAAVGSLARRPRHTAARSTRRRGTLHRSRSRSPGFGFRRFGVGSTTLLPHSFVRRTLGAKRNKRACHRILRPLRLHGRLDPFLFPLPLS